MLLRGFLGTVLFVAALPAAVCAALESGPEVGRPAPNIVGRTLDDKLYRLKSDTDSPKVINFFWVNCKPCKLEMPELAELEKQYPKVKFISVHSQEEKPENVAAFVQALPGAPSNIVLTSGGIKEAFRYLGLPHTVVLDRNNVVLMNFTGYTPENMERLNAGLQQFAKE